MDPTLASRLHPAPTSLAEATLRFILQPQTTVLQTMPPMTLPDVMVLRSGPWEWAPFAVPVVNFTEGGSTASRYYLEKSPQGLINPSDYKAALERFRHVLEMAYRTRGQRAVAMWLVGYCGEHENSQEVYLYEKFFF